MACSEMKLLQKQPPTNNKTSPKWLGISGSKCDKLCASCRSTIWVGQSFRDISGELWRHEPLAHCKNVGFGVHCHPKKVRTALSRLTTCSSSPRYSFTLTSRRTPWEVPKGWSCLGPESSNIILIYVCQMRSDTLEQTKRNRYLTKETLWKQVALSLNHCYKYMGLNYEISIF